MRRRFLGQVIELRLGGEFGIEHLRAPIAICRAGGAGHHLGQPVIGLRAEHHVDPGRAAHDLAAFGLGDAAGHRDDARLAGIFARPLDCAQPAEFGEHLLCRLLADVAGVEDHHVGAFGRVRHAIAERR